jgi:FkbM family methyltransferase
MTIPNIIVNSIHGPMIVNENDQYIGQSIRQLGAWAQDDIDLIASFCDIILANKPKMVLYDVGANIGSHTVALAKKYGNRITIRSFEAQRQVYYTLCGNIAINGLDNVICEYAAVSDVANTVISIQLPDYNTVNNFGGVELMPAQYSDNQTMIKPNLEFIKTTTLDSYNDNVDFIKIDVEGMEHLALEGARQILTKHRPVCFVEIFKTDQSRVKQIFKELNYIAYAYKQDDWIFCPAEGDFELNGVNTVDL